MHFERDWTRAHRSKMVLRMEAGRLQEASFFLGLPLNYVALNFLRSASVLRLCIH
jgi:hypothetical protein